jgi:hypothetical protein
MNKKYRFLSLIFCLSILLVMLTTGCASSSNEGDKFVMGGTYRLNEGKTIDGNLSIFGGAVTLEKDSTVNGNVVLIGGTINAAGTINGGINGFGGSITLDDTAVVQGDVATVGAAVNKSEKAEIQGKVISQSEGGVQLPDVPRFVVPALIKPFGDALGALLRALVIGVLAILVMLFMPRQTSRIGEAIVDSPFTTGAIGLLTLILFPFIAIILAITIILIPLSLIAIVVLGLGLILGWIAIGLEMGNRIANLFKGDWAPAVSAGIGTMVLTILASLFNAIPCVGWVVPTVVVLLATGGVVITIFGTKSINTPPARPGPVVPIAPNPPISPASPVTPAAPVIVPFAADQADGNATTVDELIMNSTASTLSSPILEQNSQVVEEPEKKAKPKTRKTKPVVEPPENE